MALRLISVLGLAMCSDASGIAADFEKACQEGQQDCIEDSEDMYLIQKHVEVGSAALEAKAGGDGDTVTTKGGGDDDEAQEAVACPKTPGYDKDGQYINHFGYERRFGYTRHKEVFVQSIADVDNIEKCSLECTSRDDCNSFQWESSESYCYLSTETTPLCNFDTFRRSDKGIASKDGCDLEKMGSTMYCSKVDPCTIQLNPFAYWNTTHDLERNMLNAWNTVHRCWTEYVAIVFASWLIWSALAFLMYQVFFTNAPELYNDAEDPVETFELGHFQCGRREKLCCCAFFCPAALWADTMNLAGFVKPPFSLFLFCVAGLLNALTNWCNNFLFGIFTCALLVHHRQKLRAKLMVKHSTAATYWNDCVYVFLCPCCAIAQEAMVVRNQLSRVSARTVQDKTRGVIRKDVSGMVASEPVLFETAARVPVRTAVPSTLH